MAQQVSGSTVLDVGTSEGILPILLGREGLTVDGIDLNARAIEYARNLLSQEGDAVAGRISYHAVDLVTFLQDKTFDTIIAGEVLEHLISAPRFFAICSQHLAPTGRLILTTPFGIHPDPDHKASYFLSDIVRFASPHMAIRSLDVVDGYIRLVAEKPAAAKSKEQSAAHQKDNPSFLDTDEASSLLLKTEAATYAAQMKALRLLDERRRQLEGTSARIKSVEAERDALKSEGKRLVGDAEALARDKAKADVALKEAQARLEQAAAENRRLAGDAEALARDKAKADVALKEAHARLEQAADVGGEQILTNALSPGTIVLGEEAVSFHGIVEAGSEYELEITFAPGKSPKERKLAIVIVRFFTEDGTELEAPYETFSSSKIGAYRYLSPVKSEAVPLVLPFRAPPGAARGIFGLRSWLDKQPVAIINRLRLARAKAGSDADKLKVALQRLAPLALASNPGADALPVPSIRPLAKALYVLDEFSEASWARVFDLTALGRQDFASQIAEADARFVFLESCWNGNAGDWRYAFTSSGLKHANARALLDAIERIRQRGLPIVFWNKEDPMHYERYLPIAKHCDIILTTDSNRLADYRRDVPAAKVDVLPFAASPEICNPADRFRKTPGTVCFAGSYMGVGHDERKRQMDALLPAIVELKGTIYDRMSKTENERYAFPEIYRPFIRPAVPFSEIVDVYKSFKLFLNVNTITDSPTMMSRRVYELLACGTPVISTPSRALAEQFPGIVQIANDAEEAMAIARPLLDDEWEWSRLSHRGYREVMLNHTYAGRAAKVLEMLGEDTAKREPALVSAITATRRPHFIDRIAENLGRQTHPNLEAILVTQDYTSAEVARLKETLARRAPNLRRAVVIEDNGDTTLGMRLNHMAAASKGEYVAKMDDDDLYFANYLQDMLIPFTFCDCGVVGKRELFVYMEGENITMQRFKDHRHRYTEFVAGPTFVIKRQVLDEISFADGNQGEDTKFLKEAVKNKIRIYASDPFNFIQWRSQNHLSHTWKVES